MICRQILQVFLIYNFIILLIKAAPPSVNNRKTRNIQTNCDCVCGMSNRHMRVVGGNITKIHEFPWLVGLSESGEFHCGATLITRRHLLTAAHCVSGFHMKHLRAVLADHDRSATDRLSNIVIRGFRRIREHEAYDPNTYNNDIAILELDDPVDFNANIQPACLPDNVVDYAGQVAVVAGWGQLGENQPSSHILRKVAVPVWSKQECYASGYGERKISENMFCAGYPGGEIDACQGDCGGPLHMNNVNGDMEIIGIVSWGRGCARPNLPGVYTKVGNYLDWINDALNGECLCQHPQHSSRRVGFYF